MSCPASAGEAETANGASARMMLLGLTAAYYSIFRGSWFVARGSFKLPRKVPVVPTYYNMWARAGIAKLPRRLRCGRNHGGGEMDADETDANVLYVYLDV